MAPNKYDIVSQLSVSLLRNDKRDVTAANKRRNTIFITMTHKKESRMKTYV
jgi:hypothetical protein